MRSVNTGRRLALWALAKDYGQCKLPHSGPIYADAEVRGNMVVIKFDHAYGGLAARDGKPLSHFTIAGDDKIFHPATAQIVGETIVVHADNVAKPVAVRFAWIGTAEPNLVNKAGLPASPFRTDTWPGVTDGSQ